MIGVEHKQFFARHICELADVLPVRMRAWRLRHRLFPDATAAAVHQRCPNRFSLVDAAVLVTVKVMVDKGLNLPDTIGFAETYLRPLLRRVLHDRLNKGIRTARYAELEQDAGDWPGVKPFALNLTAVAEMVIRGLNIPAPPVREDDAREAAQRPARERVN